MRKKWILTLGTLLLLGLPCVCQAEEDIQAYPVPEGTPSQAVWFDIRANGKEVGVYSDYNMEFNEVNFAYFNFRPGVPVEVNVDVKFPFRSVEILPKDQSADYEVNGQRITLRTDQPGKNYSFVFDHDYQYITLHLFTNPLDEEEEKLRSSLTTLYFGPGYHDFSKTQLKLMSGITLYVAAGAVINGPVVVENARNVTIAGSGVIMMDRQNAENPQYGNIVITLNHAQDVTIRGVIAHAHRAQNWTTHVYYSQNVKIENYHVVSTQYASVDALDISNSQNVSVSGCFLRSCDDCITIKGLSSAASPSLAPANEHISVSHCQLWNDVNNAMVIGEESMAAYYDDITFRDIDVLYSYDDRDHHERLDERAALSIVSLHGTYIRNITWEDIRVNNCQRLICFTFKDSFWFGTLQGNQSFPGGIERVTLRNITCDSKNESKIANQILLNGWNDEKLISDVLFDHVVVNGQKLTSMVNPYFRVNNYVRNIRFQ